MKRIALLVALTAACAGCQSVTKYKSVTIEYDAEGRQVRRVESESATQAEQTSQQMKLKHLTL